MDNLLSRFGAIEDGHSNGLNFEGQLIDAADTRTGDFVQDCDLFGTIQPVDAKAASDRRTDGAVETCKAVSAVWPQRDLGWESWAASRGIARSFHWMFPIFGTFKNKRFETIFLDIVRLR